MFSGKRYRRQLLCPRGEVCPVASVNERKSVFVVSTLWVLQIIDCLTLLSLPLITQYMTAICASKRELLR